MKTATGREVDQPSKLGFDGPTLLVKLLKRKDQPTMIVVVQLVEERCEHMYESTRIRQKKQVFASTLAPFHASLPDRI